MVNLFVTALKNLPTKTTAIKFDKHLFANYIKFETPKNDDNDSDASTVVMSVYSDTSDESSDELKRDQESSDWEEKETPGNRLKSQQPSSDMQDQLRRLLFAHLLCFTVVKAVFVVFVLYDECLTQNSISIDIYYELSRKHFKHY